MMLMLKVCKKLPKQGKTEENSINSQKVDNVLYVLDDMFDCLTQVLIKSNT